MRVFRCYTEKRTGFDFEAQALLHELRCFLGISGLETVRVLCRYDVEGVTQDVFRAAGPVVFSQPQTDDYFDEHPPDFGRDRRTLLVESVPGQYDQRADACGQCLQLLSIQAGQGEAPSVHGARPIVLTARLFVFSGNISDADMEKIRGFIINPVESREATFDKPDTLVINYPAPDPVETLVGFTSAGEGELAEYLKGFGLAMDMGDLRFMQEYFRDTEKREPTVAELRVIDTYWSDHCRHTTFFTHIKDISISDADVAAAYDAYLAARREVYGELADSRPQTLMDIATIAAKVLRARGLLTNIEDSEEVNACSIHIDAKVGGEPEDWILMFKNETHNHPTEVEPFGGAATCVGGGIRDPLSGRAFVYQAMRITGAGDPRTPYEETIPGKMPQRKLTKTAALGNSSYGNQVGLSAGFGHEIYHPGYVAKRMELGALVGAVKAENIIRETPIPGDKIILLGGRTGRDGIGGAVGSSKSHTAESLVTIAAEVQKGDAPEERKILRLFLDPEVTKIIKKCNDFGAGGVSVAVGELADGLDIDLSLVRCKYDGMSGTEIAISESQERMAIVVGPGDVAAFIEKAAGEGLEAYVIAEVTRNPRMVIRHEGRVLVDLSREFLSTNGAVKFTSVQVPKLEGSGSGDKGLVHKGEWLVDSSFSDPCSLSSALPQRLKQLVSDLRFCSQRGLSEMFDGTVGASGVLMKAGGKTQSTPTQVMASLLPVWDRETTTCSVMAYGYDPYLSSENPFTGARTAVISSVAKLVAAGCDPDVVYLSFQEYFERLHGDPIRWGKPFSALLGAFEAQMGLDLAAIGGKDSMSGSYNDMDVPPTLVSFAIAPNDAEHVISPEFKKAGHDVVLFKPGQDLSGTKSMWRDIRALIESKTIVSAWAVTEGGAVEGLFKMALGHEIGFESAEGYDPELLFAYTPGEIIAEVTKPVPDAVKIGRTISEPVLKLGDQTVDLSELKSCWESTLENVFPTRAETLNKEPCQPGADPLPDVPKISYDIRSPQPEVKTGAVLADEDFAKPRALILAFPGTNSELDTKRAVSRAGGAPRIVVVRNKTPEMIAESYSDVLEALKECNMLILPGGSSVGDEPAGSAKFISAFFRDSRISDAVHEHLRVRDGLILGICNGYQALIKLGLVPFGEIITPDPDMPALTYNTIGRHQAKYVYTRVASVNSPWMSKSSVGDVHAVAISHGEGRFTASPDMLDRLVKAGQIATQYTDIDGYPSMDDLVNPNGSALAVEGLFSPDGRVFGKMGHTERRGAFVAINIYGDKHQPVFESGVNYYR